MTKRAKGWLIAAFSLVLVGAILFVGVMTVLKWDFKKLSTVQYTATTHAVTEAFTNISVADSVADIAFVPSTDGTVSVTCHEDKQLTHSVAVEGDTLVVKTVDSRKWYRYVGIHFDAPRITVCLPEGTYGSLVVQTDTGDVFVPADFAFESVDIAVSTGAVTCSASAAEEMKIKTSTGSVRLSDLSVGSLDVTVSTGRVEASSVVCDGDMKVRVSTGKTYLSHVTCRNLTSTGSTGAITLRDVVAAEAFSIERSTGDVHFDACDAATLTVTTDTGDIEGSLLTEKVFVTHTDTGRVSVPESVEGGKCQLTTDTGDIKVRIQ